MVFAMLTMVAAAGRVEGLGARSAVLHRPVSGRREERLLCPQSTNDEVLSEDKRNAGDHYRTACTDTGNSHCVVGQVTGRDDVTSGRGDWYTT